MAISGVDSSSGSVSLQLNGNSGSGGAIQTAAQKLAEAKAEAKAGINDGDEKPGVGATVNKLA
jgi:hypothetical protein